ncbi:unnamed protein product [Rhizophagus irregularis]|nr:unnamed protein product [Rhizophagus irregularis]
MFSAKSLTRKHFSLKILNCKTLSVKFYLINSSELKIRTELEIRSFNTDAQIYSMHIKELKDVQALIDKLNLENSFNAKEFVQYDNDKITTEMLSNEEILKAVIPNNQEKEIEESLDPLPLISTHSEAIEYYDKVILYLE